MSGVAVIAGVGAEEGLGARLARRAAVGGLHAVIAGRTAERLEAVASKLRAAGLQATAVPTDVSIESNVVRLFEAADAIAPGGLELAVFNAGNNRPGSTLDMTREYFEDTWRVGCLGGFLFGREAARRQTQQKRGTLIFTGASASLRGKPNFVAFASAKAGLRAIAQALAREFGPAGVHVAHVVIDGGIAGERLISAVPEYAKAKGEDGLLGLDAIAEAFWQLHGQHRSAWTHELDLRPFKEPW